MAEQGAQLVDTFGGKRDGVFPAQVLQLLSLDGRPAAGHRLGRPVPARIDRYDTEIGEFDIEGTLAFAEHLVNESTASGSRPGSSSGSGCRSYSFLRAFS